MNKKGMTMIETLMAIAIISISAMTYVSVMGYKAKENNEIGDIMTMKNVAIKVMEEKRVKYQNIADENFLKEEDDISYMYNDQKYKVKIKAKKENELIMWKMDKKDFIKINVVVEKGMSKAEVTTYVTKNKK